MQFLSRLCVLLGILIFNIHYTAVPYLVNIGLIVGLKATTCKEASTLKASRSFKPNLFTLSQASPNTLTGDGIHVDEYGDKTTDNYVDDVTRRKEVEIEEDEELQEELDPCDSLCFLELPELGEPVQIVYPNRDHTELLVDFEALKVLENIPKPVYPIAFIGSVNAGKSFLLNLVNDNHFCNACPPRRKSKETPEETHKYFEDGTVKRLKAEGRDYENPKGFKVANSPEPETMGVWVYSQPLVISKKKLQEKLNQTEGESNIQLYSLKKVKTNEESNENSRLSRQDQEGKEEKGMGDLVHVVLFDVEGFNSQNNVFKYDEALFSVVSTVCSEIVYLSNKTLNTSDLQLVEELIKSSLLSKIANLYTTYGEMGEFRDDREEVFQYFLKMFEAKNLTFLISEYNYTSEQALESLVKLLKAPKRDLSLHELYLYHNKNKSVSRDKEESEKLAKKIKLYKQQKLKVNQEHEKRLEGRKELVERQTNVCEVTHLEMEDVMFTSFGYIFHMLFNSVNIAVLPSTSRNPFAEGYRMEKKDPKKEQREMWNLKQEYIDQLKIFKSDLFKRSTKTQLEKYCILDGEKSTCYMTGRDLGEMIKFTVKTLSLNKFYKLATTIGEVEGLDNLKYKDAFDEFFKVFRSTRLLLIKNDLYETYRVILRKYVEGETITDSKKLSQKKDEIPTTEMFEEYSRELKEKLLNILIKNYENETFTENFIKIKNDMLLGFDKLAELALEDLKEKIVLKCTDVSEMLYQKYRNKVESIKLPVVPSRLKFVLNVPDEFRNNFRRWIDQGELELESKVEEEEEEEGREASRPENKLVERRKDQLSYDPICYQIFESYQGKLTTFNEELLKRNEELIDKHFRRVLNKAVKNFKTKFVESEENYDLKMSEVMEKMPFLMKQSETIMVAHLGEFHAIEYLVDEYRKKLTMKLDEQLQKFETNYKNKCKEQVTKIRDNYLDNYKEFLNKYTTFPANPEALFKYNEFIKHMAVKELLVLRCADMLTKHQIQLMVRNEIDKKYKEIRQENVKAIMQGLESEFQYMDQYLKSELPSCSYYSYFRYNAHRFATYRLTQKLIYDKFNLQKVPEDPLKVLNYEDLMVFPELQMPYQALEPTLRDAPDFDFAALDVIYMKVNKNKLQKKFMEEIIKYYMENNVEKFKKYFFQKHCNAVVLLCSIVLLGLSSLSFLLAEHWVSKLFFSLLGFVSYAFMVGIQKTKDRLRLLLRVLHSLALSSLLGLLQVIKFLLDKLLHFVATGLTVIILKMPAAKYYIFGLLTATLAYFYTRIHFYRLKRRRAKNQNSNK